jgi:hypothetical protein
MAIYKTWENAKRKAHPGYGVRQVATGYQVYKIPKAVIDAQRKAAADRKAAAEACTNPRILSSRCAVG